MGQEKEQHKDHLDFLLGGAVKENASDIHIVTDETCCFRIGPDLVRVESSLGSENAEEMIYSIVSDEQRQILEESSELDFSYQTDAFDLEGLRLRVNVGRERKGLYATFRIIPKDIRKIEELGFPDDRVWQDITGLNKGLVLVTGVTGSGKSTTLASLIQHINHTRPEKIITIEDPIEYVHASNKALIVQREIGKDTQSFYSGVKWSLRQDPDILLIGEIRDRETARAALTAAETGHLVFSTLHTKDAVGTLSRYTDLFEGHEQGEIRGALADNFAYIISQQLVPYERRENRALAVEILKNISSVQALVRKGNFHQIPSYIESNAREGMITMDRHLENLYKEGRITVEDAVQYASNRDELEKRLGPETE